MKYYPKLITSWKTVFTNSELKSLLWISNNAALNNILQTMKKNNLINNPCYGIRTLDNYDKIELATKIRFPSYVSFETILQKYWIIYQNYQHTIMLAWNNTLKKTIDWITIEYHKLKPSLLTNPLWLNYTWKYFEATQERAVCDMVYLYKNINFDRIDWLDLTHLSKISEIYPQSTYLLIKKLIKNAQSR